MVAKFSEMLAEGGKKNTLGRAEEVVEIVLHDKNRLAELYNCLHSEDAWVRMRAIDALEKVCRQHPEWLEPYINKLFIEFLDYPQPSMQWHVAQIFTQIKMTPHQEARVIDWLEKKLQNSDEDWIVAANYMKALTEFNRRGAFSVDKYKSILEVQMSHRSPSVRKLAEKLASKI